MQHDFAEIELAFDSVSSQMQSMCTAYLCRTDGKIYYQADATGIYDDLPDDFEIVRNGLLDDWFNYEQTETEEALKQWCKDNSIELIPGNPGNAR